MQGFHIPFGPPLTTMLMTPRVSYNLGASERNGLGLKLADTVKLGGLGEVHMDYVREELRPINMSAACHLL